MTWFKRLSIIGLSLVLLLLSLWYSFLQPFKPGAVLGAIPLGASGIQQVDSVDELLGSAFFEELDQLFDGSLQETWLTDNPWINRLAPSEIAVARLKYNRTVAPDAWVAVSWVGWRGPWLRWRLEQLNKDEFSFLGKSAAWPIWKYELPHREDNMILTCALTDQLFMVCFSESTTDIMLLLDTYDNQVPSVKNAK